jgi:hypothetical protein
MKWKARRCMDAGAAAACLTGARLAPAWRSPELVAQLAGEEEGILLPHLMELQSDLQQRREGGWEETGSRQ